jgi:hypothetical protein
MALRPLTPTKYNNVVRDLELPATQESAAKKSDVRAKFGSIVDAMIDDDASALKTAHEYVSKRLSGASVKKILDAISPGLSNEVSDKLGASFERVGSSGSNAGDLRTAFANVKSLLEYGEASTLAKRTLAKHDLTLTSVAYADGHRTFGVSGDYISDVRLKGFEPNAMRRLSSSREATALPFVKDSNWSGPFGVIDLAAFTVKNKNGRSVSLKDVIEDPARHVNGWNGPDVSFFSESQDEVRRTRGGTTGPKAAAMDALVPATDGSTDTVPSIYTYGKPMLVLVAVPGEGVSAHFTDGSSELNLPIHEGGREKAMRITRQSLSDREGPTSFDRGSSAVDDMLINSALIIQIPVNDPNHRPRRGGFGGGFALESFGGAAALSFAGSSRGIDSGNLGTEAGVVSAGGDLGRQKAVPQRITREENSPVRVDFVFYAATDANTISDGLAKRMRNDMDSIINHPACEKATSEN